MPVLVLWGALGVVARLSAPVEIWRNDAAAVLGHAVDAGHFFIDEQPARIAHALEEFLRSRSADARAGTGAAS